MATGSDWMSAASFIGMAGTIFGLGYDGLAYIMGWRGGYVLLAVFLGPYLRKFGQYTIPDFLGGRYGGNAARTIGIVAPAEPKGVNSEGLKRRGFDATQIANIKSAYRLFYRSGLKQDEAAERLRVLAQSQPEVQQFVDFLAASERSIIRC